MLAIFIVKSDRVLLTRRFSDERWQPSCVGVGDPSGVLERELGIRARLTRCPSDLEVYRAVSADPIATTHEIDEIEWVLIDDLPHFIAQNRSDPILVPALRAFLEGLGSSIGL
jgi:hypothetical protein